MYLPPLESLAFDLKAVCGGTRLWAGAAGGYWSLGLARFPLIYACDAFQISSTTSFDPVGDMPGTFPRYLCAKHHQYLLFYFVREL